MALDVSHHIGQGIGVFLTAALMAWIHHRARRPVPSDPFSGEKVLKFSWILVVTALVNLGFSICCSYSMFYDLPRSPNFGIVMAIGFGGLCTAWVLFSLSMLSIWLGYRVVVGAQGITRYSTWMPPLTIEWDDVAEVFLTRRLGSFIVLGKDGQRIRLSNDLNGLGDFAMEVRRRLPRQKYRSVETHASFSMWLQQSYIEDLMAELGTSPQETPAPGRPKGDQRGSPS